MSTQPTPIHWRNFRKWLRKTTRLDDDLFQPSARGVGPRRLMRSLLPRLQRPLFIIGAPRSGTSFLGDAVGSLPEFSYHYEPPMTKAAARYVYEGSWSFRKARRFYRFTYAWLLRRHLDGDLRFAEKTPQNCFVVDFLNRAFQDAQFVHIIRDGRDAALSYREKPWLREDARSKRKRESGGYLFGPYARFWVEPERRAEFESTSDLHRCIWAWRRHLEAALSQTAVLASRQVHQVRYESLCRNPVAEADRLLDFLGVVARTSKEQLLRHLESANERSVGRWRRELNDEESSLIEREAGSLLLRLEPDGEAPR
ncbi:MAG: sulfotransferase [Planctomycetota bacterium]